MSMPPKSMNSKQPISTSQATDSKHGDAKPQLFSKVGAVFLIAWIIALFLIAQMVGIYLFAPVVFSEQTLTTAQRFGMGSFDGTVTSYAMIFTLVVMVATTYALIKWQISRVSRSSDESTQLDGVNGSDKPFARQTVADYLAIKRFSYKVGLGVLGLWLLFVIGSEALTYLFDRNPTAFVDDLYFSANPKWLLILVMVVIAPLYEEIMFRGILWSAIREQVVGRNGVILASVVTSVLFAIIHLQYAVYEMSVIFILALLLSYARAKSGSLLLPIIIHMINNGVAMWMYLSL